MVVLLIFTNSVLKLQNVLIRTVSNFKGVYLLIVRYGIYRLQNVQIRTVPSYKRDDLLILMDAFSRCETLKYGQCFPAMKLIC